MPMTLAGVPLLAPTREVREWVRRNVPVEKAVPFLDRAWPGSLLSNRSIAFPSRPRAPRHVEVNTLRWPRGADRFALGCFLVSADQLGKIRDGPEVDDGVGSLELVMSADGQASAETLTTDLMLLKVIPLSSVPAEDNPDRNNAILLICVDVRYYWQTIPCPDFGIPYYGASRSSSEGGTGATVPTWANLVTMATTALTITYTCDPIPAAYLSPDPSLNLQGAPAGLVLEAICRNIGMQFVRNYDGTCAIMGTSTANAIRAADLAANPDRTLRAGGEWFQDDP